MHTARSHPGFEVFAHAHKTLLGRWSRGDKGEGIYSTPTPPVTVRTSPWGKKDGVAQRTSHHVITAMSSVAGAKSVAH